MTPKQVQFAVDGMLQSLGTWLRLLGYDCSYRQGLTSRKIFELALAEQRVFLSRNKHLSDTLPAPLMNRGQIEYIQGEHLPEQLREVVHKFQIETEQYAFTRCLQCNMPLEQINKPTTGIPENVAATEQKFWRCPACRQVFWRGSHVNKSMERLRLWFCQ